MSFKALFSVLEILVFETVSIFEKKDIDWALKNMGGNQGTKMVWGRNLFLPYVLYKMYYLSLLYSSSKSYIILINFERSLNGKFDSILASSSLISLWIFLL